MSIEERVKKIISEQLRVDLNQITDNKKFINDLGADSLETVELVMALEDEFDVEIPDEDAQKIITVGDAMEYVRQKMTAQEQA